MRKAFDIIRTAVTYILLIAAVSITLFTFVSVSIFDKNDRDIFGYKAFIVLSDSMKATDFAAGDVILIKEVDPSSLEEGDIISFISKSSESYGETVTHKIRSVVEKDNGEKVFVTYGTTTDTDDSSAVSYYDVLGKYVLRLPKIGSFFNFMKTVPGYICCILIPFLLLIAVQGVNTVKVFRQYKKEQNEALQAEKDKLKAEMEKSQKMEAELEALKAKISTDNSHENEEK